MAMLWVIIAFAVLIGASMAIGALSALKLIFVAAVAAFFVNLLLRRW